MDKILPVPHVPSVTPALEVANRTPKPAAPRAAPAPASSAPPPLSVATVVAAIVAQGVPIDLEKVARVRSQIARGAFALDSAATAGAILKLAERDR